MGRRNKNRLVLKPFCYYCDAELDSLPRLVRHQRRRHFSCVHCGKQFDRAAGLATHVRIVHGEELRAVPGALPARARVGAGVVGMKGVPREAVELRKARLLEQLTLGRRAPNTAHTQPLRGPQSVEEFVAIVSSERAGGSVRGANPAEARAAEGPNGVGAPNDSPVGTPHNAGVATDDPPGEPTLVDPPHWSITERRWSPQWQRAVAACLTPLCFPRLLTVPNLSARVAEVLRANSEANPRGLDARLVGPCVHATPWPMGKAQAWPHQFCTPKQYRALYYQ